MASKLHVMVCTGWLNDEGLAAPVAQSPGRRAPIGTSLPHVEEYRGVYARWVGMCTRGADTRAVDGVPARWVRVLGVEMDGGWHRTERIAALGV